MALVPFPLPFAELEVGQHLYWQIGNLNLHGQVFLSSWVVIGILLALVVSGTRKMERDPKGFRTSSSFSGIICAIWPANRLAKRPIATGFLSSELCSCSSSCATGVVL